jgi:hypothetical protein
MPAGSQRGSNTFVDVVAIGADGEFAAICSANQAIVSAAGHRGGDGPYFAICSHDVRARAE